VNQPKQVESYLSSEGVGVIAGLLIIGGVLLGVTGSGKFPVVLLLLAGAVTAGWAWVRRSRPVPPEPRKVVETRPPRPTSAPIVDRPVPPEAKAEEKPEEKPEEKMEEPVEPAAPPVLPPSAAALLRALEARGPGRVTGQTVRVETLIETGDSLGTLHLVVSGDGPPRDLWFGQDGEPLPIEIIFGRMPPDGVPGVPISSKAVSAQQARLSQHDRTFLIENLSKTNATRVGGRALQDGERRALADGDLIEMGPVSIRYHFE
jgi:hypothetical protein